LQGKAGRKPRFRDDAVRAFGERRDDDEFGRGIRLACRCGNGASDTSGNFGGTRWPLTPMRRLGEDG
jgi:hypothetical protein